MTWRMSAACRDLDPDWWHPPESVRADRSKRSRQMRSAPGINICRTCAVRLSCLDYAINTDQPDGVWGGLTPTERDRHRQQRSAAAQRLRHILNDLNDKAVS